MARPRAKEPKKQFTLMMKQSDVDALDEIASEMGRSRSEVMRRYVKMGMRIINKKRIAKK
ncbi:MAG: ribbon-helix-helix protein, CopG family [Deltaproteobacteria bacterium]|nr:ribbon-helix-helix protein, CopG family [Deltaproteobacteria bacterium]